MRIRNSRPAFLSSTHLRSKVQHFDERFLVEESNRRIGWPGYPLRKHLAPDIQKVQPLDMLQPEIASKIKTGKENFLPVMQSQASQKLEEPHKEARTSNSSAASERNVKAHMFSAGIVLGLQAPSSQPARGNFFFCKQQELPLKKRKKSRDLEIEEAATLKPNKMEEAATLNPDRTEVAFNNHDAEMEEAATVEPDRTKEAFNKHDPSQTRTAINCVLNCESSHSRTYNSDGLQIDDDKLVETAALHGKKPNRKWGRLEKDSFHLSTATLGMDQN